jgi:hypothetical protein
MEYVRNICISQEDFQNLLASGYDSDLYFKLLAVATSFLGVSLLVAVNMIVDKQREVDGLAGVKNSLMKHIETLEEELTEKYTEEEEKEEDEEEGEIDTGAEAGDELDDLQDEHND